MTQIPSQKDIIETNIQSTPETVPAKVQIGSKEIQDLREVVDQKEGVQSIESIRSKAQEDISLKDKMVSLKKYEAEILKISRLRRKENSNEREFAEKLVSLYLTLPERKFDLPNNIDDIFYASMYIIAIIELVSANNYYVSLKSIEESCKIKSDKHIANKEKYAKTYQKILNKLNPNTLRIPQDIELKENEQVNDNLLSEEKQTKPEQEAIFVEKMVKILSFFEDANKLFNFTPSVASVQELLNPTDPLKKLKTESNIATLLRNMDGCYDKDKQLNPGKSKRAIYSIINQFPELKPAKVEIKEVDKELKAICRNVVIDAQKNGAMDLENRVHYNLSEFDWFLLSIFGNLDSNITRNVGLTTEQREKLIPERLVEVDLWLATLPKIDQDYIQEQFNTTQLA